MEMLLGLLPYDTKAQDVYEIILEKYPNGPMSLMVELPPSWPRLVKAIEEGADYAEVTRGREAVERFKTNIRGKSLWFYHELANKFLENGARIIYGNPFDEINAQFFIEITESFRKGNFRGSYFWKFLGWRAVDSFRRKAARVTHKPEKMIIEVLGKEEPQVAAISRRFARHIRPDFPEARYIDFRLSGEPDFEWADEVVEVEE